MSEQRPLFSTRTTLLLMALLILPYAIKGLTSAEPFPAVIFPGGATTIPISSGGLVSLEYFSFNGYDAQGRLHPLDRRRFLAPIPVHYSNGIASSDFGQSDADLMLWLRRTRWSIRIRRRHANQTEKDEAKAWLADRLRANSLVPDQLVVRSELATLDHRTGEELSRVTKGEQIIALR